MTVQKNELLNEMDNVRYVGSKKQDLIDLIKKAAEAIRSEPSIASTADVAKNKLVADSITTATEFELGDVTAQLKTFIDNLQTNVNTFETLQTAINAKQDELKNVHGIEVDMNSLAAIAVAKDELVAKREAEAKEIIEKAETRAQEITTAARDNEKQTRERLQNEISNAKKEEERRKEEWEYSFNREKKAKLDSISDEIAEANKELDERENELDEKEQDLAKRELKLDELEEKIETLQEEKDSAVSSAKKQATAIAESTARRNAEIREREIEADKTILNAKIDTLQDRVDTLEDELEEARQAVSDAQKQVQDIANNALQAAADKATIAEITKAGASKK